MRVFLALTIVAAAVASLASTSTAIPRALVEAPPVCSPTTECAAGQNTCSPNADCIETDAGYTCACKDGFVDLAADENPNNVGRECELPCPEGYGPHRLGDICLRVSTEPANWVTARDACRAEYGDLVSIHSEADAKKVAAIVKEDGWTPNFWIGLNDRDTEGTFTWSDGTPLDFTSWWGGQPNNHGSGQDAGTS